MNTMKNPPPGDQGLAFSNPRSTNDIVWAFLRANPAPLRFVTNRALTIGAVCGEGLCLGTGGGLRQSLTSVPTAGCSVLA